MKNGYGGRRGGETGRLSGAVFLVQVGAEGRLDSHCHVGIGINGGTGRIFVGSTEKTCQSICCVGVR